MANDFNAFIFNNADTNGGHSDGAVAVGGNWKMEYEVNGHNLGANSIPGTSNTSIYVGGSIQTQGVARSLRGNAYVGGLVTGTLDIQNGGRLNPGGTTALASIFTQQRNYSTNQSNYLASLTGQAINITDPNNINVNLSTNTANGNLKVYTVNASQLSSLSTLNLSGGNGNETVVINVVGSTVNWGWQVNYANRNKLVWNFVNATQINVENRNFDGSMLAVNANFLQKQNIQGTMIAKSWTNRNSAELHFGNQFKFAGQLPTAPVPEPGTMLAFGAGIAALIRRRKK
jgi:choice-of-anchor A domain-containing protein